MAQELKTTKRKQEAAKAKGKVLKDDLVVVVSTGGSKNFPKGNKVVVHRLAGEKLEKKGFAKITDEEAEDVAKQIPSVGKKDEDKDNKKTSK